jgi:hypothetical protein
MSFQLRPRTALHLATLGLFTALYVAAPAHAAPIDENIPDAQTLAQMELRASQASPREQCFLYTALAHTMTEKASQEIRAGETEHAADTLKQIGRLANLIHASIVKDTKRLKDAEMLLHHTSYRLGQLLHIVSGDDKTTVQATLVQLDQVNDEVLTQVFYHY